MGSMTDVYAAMGHIATNLHITHDGPDRSETCAFPVDVEQWYTAIPRGVGNRVLVTAYGETAANLTRSVDRHARVFVTFVADGQGFRVRDVGPSFANGTTRVGRRA